MQTRLDYLLSMSDSCYTFSDLLYLHLDDLVLKVLPLFVNFRQQNLRTLWLLVSQDVALERTQILRQFLLSLLMHLYKIL